MRVLQIGGKRTDYSETDVETLGPPFLLQTRPYKWKANRLSDVYALQIVSPLPQVSFSLPGWFALLGGSFIVWCNATCLFLLLQPVLLASKPKHCPYKYQEAFFLWSLLIALKSALMFKSLIQFGLIFEYSVRYSTISFFWMYLFSFLNTIYWRVHPFPFLCCW